jgi:phosphoenolpyruvate synthase/pyruvate phosphate dikinase
MENDLAIKASSKQEIIDYLKKHKMDFQNANCPLFPPDYVFPAYVNSEDVHCFEFSPNFAYYLDHNFFQIMPDEIIMGVSRKVYLNAMKDKKWYEGVLKKHFDLEKKIDLVWKKVGPIEKLSNEKLFECFMEIATLGREWWKYAAMGEDKGRIIDVEIVPYFEKNHNLSKTEATEIVSMLSHPEKEAIFTGERKSFYNICLFVLSDKQLSKLIKNDGISQLIKSKKLGKLFKKYKKEYFYSKTSFAYGKEILFEEFVKDILKEVKGKQAKHLQDELNALEKESKNIHKKRKEILSKIKLSTEEKKMIWFSTRIVEWLDYRKRGMMKQFYYIFCIFHEYEKRLPYTFDDLMSSTFEELKVVLTGKEKIDVEEINRRKEPFFAYYTKGIAKGLFYFGIEGKELFELSKGLVEKSAQLKGSVASKGSKGEKVVSGIAKIVINPTKESFEEGQILVTSMTRIEFVPLMKKARAIITDEGGIACHAAIVSRELGVPCIIGSKHATSMIKSGDKVELNLETGVVKLVK